MGFDAIKRWTLRVNNDARQAERTGPFVPPPLPRASMLAAGSRSIATAATAHVEDATQAHAGSSEATAAAAAAVDSSSSSSSTSSSSSSSSAAPAPIPTDKIDPDVLASLVATLDETEAQAVYNFVETYDGPDLSAALYAHLARIEDSARNELIVATDYDPADAAEQWDLLLAAENDSPAARRRRTPEGFVEGEEDGAEAGEGGLLGVPRNGRAAIDAVSDAADLFNLKTDTGRSTDDVYRGASTAASEAGPAAVPASAAIVVVTTAPTAAEPTAQSANAAANQAAIVSTVAATSPRRLPSLRDLPRQALHRILTSSANLDLLRVCRRLARAAPPDAPIDIAALALAVLWRPPSTTTTATTVEGAEDTNDGWDAAAAVQDLFLRCARANLVNRSPDALPWLAALLALPASEAAGPPVPPPPPPSLETLSAVVDVAARGRRWNSVRGALAVAAGVRVRVHGAAAAGTQVSAPLPPPPDPIDVRVADLVNEHMRRHMVVLDGDRRRAHAALAANVVANHGAALDGAFFRDLVEVQGLRFAPDVVQHCAEAYSLRPDAIEYLASVASDGEVGGAVDGIEAV
ncbi:hypothetical protein HK405_009902 [Cladochytrium tenue]|nr:hypothetical protein HK405_009902 [Cladochytrium tenue]